jgi:hypothetical protein
MTGALRIRLPPALALATLLAPAAARAETIVDHSSFDALLKKHVLNGMLDYDAFQKAPEFAAYLASLDAVNPAGLSDQERLAFWINTYNAFTIQLINNHKEHNSIRNINKTLGIAAHGPWREKLVKAGGQLHHLDNVEHDIIRKQFKEPRIHFALVCAAMSCPPLRSEAYAGARLDEQLQDQAVVFLTRSPKKNRIDVAKGIFYSSQIMAKYYPQDFGKDEAAIAKYLSQFFPEGPERAFLAGGRVKFVHTDYDWTLNSQQQAAAPANK